MSTRKYLVKFIIIFAMLKILSQQLAYSLEVKVLRIIKYLQLKVVCKEAFVSGFKEYKFV